MKGYAGSRRTDRNAPERPEFAPPVRIHPISAHLVIYRAQREGIDVIRVLHARQELTAFLFDG